MFKDYHFNKWVQDKEGEFLKSLEDLIVILQRK